MEHLSAQYLGIQNTNTDQMTLACIDNIFK